MDNCTKPGRRYWLPLHVLACSRIEGTVLLDLRKNRYFALSAPDSAMLACVVPNWPVLPDVASASRFGEAQVIDMNAAAALLKAELLSATEPTGCAQTRVAMAPQTAVGEEISVRAAINLRLFAIFVQSYRWARRRIRYRSLQEIRQEVLGMRPTHATWEPAMINVETVRLVSAFRTLRPCSFTAKDQCLVHSLALLKFLMHHQVFPTWIIGVQLRPWAAHSWIQMREHVFDSTPEKVCRFDPILVV